jgi:O-antigen/teichoic acid export membrane protein
MLYVSLLFPAIKAYKARMFSMVSGGIFNLIFSLLVVKFYGIYGVAISAVISEIVILILAVYFFNRNLRNT